MKVFYISILLAFTSIVFAYVLPEKWEKQNVSAIEEEILPKAVSSAAPEVVYEVPENEELVEEVEPEAPEVPEVVVDEMSQDNQNMTQEEHLERIKIQLDDYRLNMIPLLRTIKNYNYTTNYPTLNIKSQFPELKMAEDGYPYFRTPEVYQGFKFDIESYPEMKIGYRYYDLVLLIYQSNPNFRFIEFMKTLADATSFKGYKYDDNLIRELVLFKFISKDGNGKYILNTKAYKNYQDTYYSTNIPEYSDIEEDDKEKFEAAKALFKYTFTRDLKNQLLLLKSYNLKELYPGFDFKKQLPELAVNEEGYATFDIDQVIKGFDIDKLHDLDIYDYEFYQINKQFNLTKILSILAKMTKFNHIDVDSPLTVSLSLYRYIYQDNDGNYVLNDEKYFNENASYEDLDKYNLEYNVQLPLPPTMTTTTTTTKTVPEEILSEAANDVISTKNTKTVPEEILAKAISSAAPEVVYEIPENEELVEEVEPELPEVPEVVVDEMSQDNQNMTQEEHLERIKIQLDDYRLNMIPLLRTIKNYNYTTNYPTLNIKSQFPELKMAEDGYPYFRTPEVYQGFKFDIESYPEMKIGYRYYDLVLLIYQSNPNFRFIEFMKTLADATSFKGYKYVDNLTRELVLFKFISKDGNGKYILNTKDYKNYKNTYYYSNIPEYSDIEEDDKEKFEAAKALFKYTFTRDLKNQLLLLKSYNLKELYPGFDFKKQLPELAVNEEGYATFDIDQVIKGFDIDKLHDLDIYDYEFYQINKQFNLTKILSILAKMTTFNHIDVDSPLTVSLRIYKFIKPDENGYYDIVYDEYSNDSYTSY
ncbi:hypothetical protein BCR32DRAFT_306970 [Anaeromyces robustus]|uniref:Uncharacterized protein n=1 Tax=Anaeromyces robustus TaxID=1754192 RepID=A0A1Y1VSD4_9FUNG|nr:hypothetical protein BCR32DRAFT_306970 [Anaeromyces robustus]|eukprot:ORX64201.1 hypothetical protein BCR32DRAFT_306970 [Anaeromyces robustus]